MGKEGSGKTTVLQTLAYEKEQEIFSLGLVLSEALEQGLKPDKVVQFLRIIIKNSDPVFLLDNIEVLFQPSLQLNALEVLRILSHEKIIVSTFPGRVVNGAMIYAVASHPEYRVFTKYETKDIILFDLNGEEK